MPARLNPETGHGYQFKDRTGTRIGRLVFTRHVGVSRHKQQIWEALCDCGNTTRLTSVNRVMSCGCLQREAAAETQRRKRQPDEVRAAKRLDNARRQRERRKADPVAVMQSRISRLHRFALARVGALKTSPTFNQLGYSVTEFVAHIERQFVDGMGWENMRDWQIDHITPISSAGSEADVVALNQLWNLRPLWAKANNAKRSRREVLL